MRLLCPLLLLCLAACTAVPVADGRERPLDEKVLIRALTQVQADATQRAGVLAAFDRLLPARKRIERDMAAAESALAALRPLAADYPAQSAPLIARLSALWGERRLAQAQFQHAAAIALGENRWPRWQQAVASETAERQRFAPPGY